VKTAVTWQKLAVLLTGVVNVQMEITQQQPWAILRFLLDLAKVSTSNFSHSKTKAQLGSAHTTLKEEQTALSVLANNFRTIEHSHSHSHSFI